MRKSSFKERIRMKRRLRRILKRNIMINMKSMRNYQPRIGNNPINSRNHHSKQIAITTMAKSLKIKGKWTL